MEAEYNSDKNSWNRIFNTFDMNSDSQSLKQRQNSVAKMIRNKFLESKTEGYINPFQGEIIWLILLTIAIIVVVVLIVFDNVGAFDSVVIIPSLQFPF
ncbi:hypothetical protein RB653_010033 [Dictyostelium firmibasis]|uniref:Uncharacterized protein n=1 Tax=Dictyostelium firmibasis TaxID=79012 RepID=A0AAN7TSI9_9MYCE